MIYVFISPYKGASLMNGLTQASRFRLALFVYVDSMVCPGPPIRIVPVVCSSVASGSVMMVHRFKLLVYAALMSVRLNIRRPERFDPPCAPHYFHESLGVFWISLRLFFAQVFCFL